MTNKYHQRLGWLCLSVVIAETLLVILSWLLSAMRVEGVRSLLSSEGIRWFFSSFNNLIASPVLVGLLLLLCALGCLQKSRVADIFGGEKTINFRDRLALYPAFSHRSSVPLSLQSQSGTHHRLRHHALQRSLWNDGRCDA